MIRQKYIWILLFTLFLNQQLGANNLIAKSDIKSATIKDDIAKKNIMILNRLQMSLTKIISYNNKIILDEEYNNIINNINLRSIRDKEILDLVLNLMDTLSAFQLSEIDKKLIYEQYQEKLENALSKSLEFSKLEISPMVLIDAGSAYIKYQDIVENASKEYDKDKWKLKKQEIIELNKIRKKFIKTYWELMNKYNIPDSWRVTEGQLNRFIKVLKEQDSNKKLRKLLRLKREMYFLPSYWFELSIVAHMNKNKKIVMESIDRYESLDEHIMRINREYAMMLSNKVTYFDIASQKDVIVSLLKKIEIADPINPKMKIFLAIEYMLVGDFKKAEELLNENIDDNFMPKLCSKLKLDLYLKEKNIPKYKSEIKKFLDKQNLSVVDYINYFGKMPVDILAKKIKDDILNIKIEVDKSIYKNDTIIVLLPKKWVLKNIKDLNIEISTNYIRHEVSNMHIVDDAIVYEFDRAIDYQDAIDGKIVRFEIRLVYNNTPISIFYKLEKVLPQSNSISSSDNKKKQKESDNSLFGKSLSYLSNKLDTAYDKAIKTYNNLRAEVKFIPIKIKINNRCFDIQKNLEPCSR